ncbi:SPW repeat domain-containing protein [Longitalea luteola]|uniref:SPW repeat domain-containing protein n=1 Tax=Longitalea luteola TaxID=2812563 RepID=UPI001A976E0B|nr:SPW repeat protein [Longitalea luteola]
MRWIATKTHGYLDYIMGMLLIAAPWIFGFAREGAETWVPVVLGAGVILYSFMTDYELGLSPVLSMRTHLMLDLIGGALLAISPWLFGFADYVWQPHLIFGILEIGAALMTKLVPSVEKRHQYHPHQRHTTAH